VFSKQTKNKFYNFHVIKLLPELTGEVIADASSGSEGKTNQSTVKLEMNVDGAERFARITGENIKKRIAIVLDDFVYSVPRIQSKITGGNVQVSGMATAEEAKLMEIVLKAGALKAPLKLIGLKIEKQKN
jgi:preprotein translocase subunit SecD